MDATVVTQEVCMEELEHVLTVNERSGQALLATTLVGEDESRVGCQWLRRL